MSDEKPLFWYRAPIYQAMMVISAIFVFHGLVVDIALCLWARGETTLRFIFIEKTLIFFAIFIVGIIACSKTKWADLSQKLVRSWHYPEIAFLIFLFLLNGGIFSSLKSIIPIINPFYLDPILWKIDTIIHGGYNPTKLFYDFFNMPSVIEFCLFIYGFWFVIGAFFIAFSLFWFRYDLGRLRFLIAFALCWYINGVVLATLFSSVGPLFVGDFFSGDLAKFYQPYIDYAVQNSGLLKETKLIFVDFSKDNLVVDLNGISAMPSMHVSIAALLFFYTHEYFRKFSIFLLVFLLLTVFACIGLLTHYAIDAYVSIFTTWLIWRWTARYNRPAVRTVSNDV